MIGGDGNRTVGFGINRSEPRPQCEVNGIRREQIVTVQLSRQVENGSIDRRNKKVERQQKAFVRSIAYFNAE
eukprot:scaffold1942_cov197-Alexandrium_tamarense.AAC.30